MSLGHIGETIWPAHLISEGWAALREKAHNAITYFHPHDEDSPNAAPVTQRWGLIATDVVEHDDYLELRMEVPGVSKADLKVSISSGQVVVTGEKHAAKTTRKGNAFITERAFGAFSRTIPLPASVVVDQAQASYEDGILAINLPKAPGAGAKQIKVS